jgi:hypothetical protein
VAGVLFAMAVTTTVGILCEGVLGALRNGPGAPDGASFEVYDEHAFRSPMSLGVSLWVHRLALDSVVRSGVVRSRAEAGRAVEVGVLLTPWAPSARARVDLLGWTLSGVDRNPVIELASGARVQVAVHALTGEEMVQLGARVGGSLPTSIACVCRGTVE